MRPKATNLYRLHILSITIILQNKYGIIHGHDSLSILAYGIWLPQNCDELEFQNFMSISNSSGNKIKQTK